MTIRTKQEFFDLYKGFKLRPEHEQRSIAKEALSWPSEVRALEASFVWPPGMESPDAVADTDIHIYNVRYNLLSPHVTRVDIVKETLLALDLGVFEDFASLEVLDVSRALNLQNIAALEHLPSLQVLVIHLQSLTKIEINALSCCDIPHINVVQNAWPSFQEHLAQRLPKSKVRYCVADGHSLKDLPFCEKVFELQKRTNHGLLDCKNALLAHGEDVDEAEMFLQYKVLAINLRRSVERKLKRGEP